MKGKLIKAVLLWLRQRYPCAFLEVAMGKGKYHIHKNPVKKLKAPLRPAWDLHDHIKNLMPPVTGERGEGEA